MSTENTTGIPFEQFVRQSLADLGRAVVEQGRILAAHTKILTQIQEKLDALEEHDRIFTRKLSILNDDLLALRTEVARLVDKVEPVTR